jgi:hypothetical protein
MKDINIKQVLLEKRVIVRRGEGMEEVEDSECG